MPHELAFLAVATPSPIEGLDDGSLLEMKVESRPGKSPHIAFSSVELGYQLISGRQMGSEYVIDIFSALLPEQAEKAQNKDVLLFEHPQEVTRYLEDSKNYDFESHIFSFEEAERRLKNAL